MKANTTINGVPVTEEQIASWVDEDEVGYGVELLKKCGRGRPGRGAAPSQVVALQLTAEEISSRDGRAQSEGKSRLEVICEAFNLLSSGSVTGFLTKSAWQLMNRHARCW